MVDMTVSGTLSVDAGSLIGPEGPQGPQGPQGPAAPAPLYYSTTTELVSQLNVYTGAQVTVYEISLGSVAVDKIINVTAQFEVTNQYSYNSMLGRYLWLTSDQANFYINKPATCNTTPNMHHQTVNLARNIKITQNLTNVKIQLRAYAASYSAQSGHYNTVEQGYGHLDCIVF